MTGFASKEESAVIGDHHYNIVWEIKSVNGKNLDLRLKLPSALENMDPVVKGIISEYFVRGSVMATLTITDQKENSDIEIDANLLKSVTEQLSKIYQDNPDLFVKSSAAEILQVPGVIKPREKILTDEENEALKNVITSLLISVVKQMKDDRQKEGQKMESALKNILNQIEEKCFKAEEIFKTIKDQIKVKILAQIDDFQKDINISKDRLEQEVLFYIMRADVREELDRLKAHIVTAREIFEKGGTVGRRLDFLCQELNREANTFCSKSLDLELTKIGMDLKALIEQFREQVQNME